MRCQKCQHQNRDGVKFCESCGTKIESQDSTACIGCGAANPPGARFCKSCGSSLQNKARDASSPSVPQGASSKASSADMQHREQGKSERVEREERVPRQQKTVEQAVKKGGKGKWVALLILLVLLFGVYKWLFGDDSNKRKTKNQAAVSAEKHKPAPTSDSSFFAQAQKYIAGMVEASKMNNPQILEQNIASLEMLNKPEKGNRKVARQFNESGLAAIKIQDYKTAIKELTQALDYDQSDAEIFGNLGYAYYESGDYPKARGCIEVSIALAPRRASAWTNYGVILFKQGFQEQAVYAYLLAYKFSKKPDVLAKFVESHASDDPDTSLRWFYSQVQQAANARY